MTPAKKKKCFVRTARSLSDKKKQLYVSLPSSGGFKKGDLIVIMKVSTRELLK